MKGREKYEHIWCGNGIGGSSGITEFEEKRKGEGKERERTENKMGANPERELGGKRRLD